MQSNDLTAIEWIIRRDRGLTASEVEALAEWLAADPRNVAEYARMSGDWQSLDVIGAVPALAAMADVAQTRAKARQTKRRIWTAAAGLLAAAAAIVVLLVHLRRAPPVSAPVSEAKSYVVLQSTARRMQLQDGSIALLNGDSRIKADFTPAERRVTLVSGEALFEVAKNPARPFIVSAGSVAVRAVGTAFEVRLSAGSVAVIVTEGKVRVGSASLGCTPPGAGETGAHSDPCGQPLVAGERAVIRAKADAGISVSVDKPAPAEIDAALGWESPRLVFDHTPLDQVVAAFNRYNTRQFVIADPSLRTRTLTGVFRADNFDGFTRLLSASVDVVAEVRGDHETILRSAR